jgi:hypothetical protein
MTPGEFREYVKIMKEFGLTRAKLGENVELIMGAGLPVEDVVSTLSSSPVAETGASPLPLSQPAPDNDVISHKVSQIHTLLNMNDTELAENLFPDPKPSERA